MASNRYRQIYTSFWTDPKIEEEFTPEDKYFYLYLLTNPYTNIAGCYEIGYKQLARGTGYNEDTVKRLIDRLKNMHKVIDYNEENKEVLILNWHKYNWSRSDNLLTGVAAAVKDIKTPEFARYLKDLTEGLERVYRGSIDTVQTTVTVTVSDTDTEKSKDIKHKYGEYQHVMLTDANMEKLKEMFPDDLNDRIRALDEYIEETGKSYKNHFITITRWAKKDKNESEQPNNRTKGGFLIV